MVAFEPVNAFRRLFEFNIDLNGGSKEAGLEGRSKEAGLEGGSKEAGIEGGKDKDKDRFRSGYRQWEDSEGREERNGDEDSETSPDSPDGDSKTTPHSWRIGESRIVVYPSAVSATTGAHTTVRVPTHGILG